MRTKFQINIAFGFKMENQNIYILKQKKLLHLSKLTKK